MKIAILDDYQDVVKDLACFHLLKQHQVTLLNKPYSERALVDKLKETEAIVLIRERSQITASLLSQLPQLKIISQTGKVAQHIDPSLCESFGIRVLEGVGSPIAPAELCWALIMAASRNLPAYIATMQSGHWQQSGALGLGRSLHGLTLGIWGYGKIGRRVCHYGKAFGMKVLVWGSTKSREKAQADGFAAAESKRALFQDTDVLSLHLRLNQATKGCVTHSDLHQMKSDSLFVNTSRAALIEPGALYRELHQYPSKSAAIDVYDIEPASIANEPLLSLPNVVTTPHLGYVEQNSYEIYFRAAFENLLAHS